MNERHFFLSLGLEALSRASSEGGDYRAFDPTRPQGDYIRVLGFWAKEAPQNRLITRECILTLKRQIECLIPKAHRKKIVLFYHQPGGRLGWRYCP